MNFAIIWENRQLLIDGLINTVVVIAITVVTATVLGFAVAVVRNAHIPLATPILRLYLELFRGSPLLVQLLFIYFGVAYLGLNGLSVFGAVIIGITLFSGAYISEVFRAGLQAVPRGQLEVAETLGLSPLDRLWFVVLPQAMRISLGPLFGQYISLIKNTAVASALGYADLITQGLGIVNRYHNPFAVFCVIGIAYFILSVPFSVVALHFERKGAHA